MILELVLANYVTDRLHIQRKRIGPSTEPWGTPEINVVIALSETWLIDNDTDSFNIDGYKMFTCSRTNKSGGGVALYINDSLQHKYLPYIYKCLDNCAEVVSLEIALTNGKKALICCIYRAPKTDLEQLN